MTVLVDTSVWVDHLRKPDPALVELLDTGLVLLHPFVIGELACGNLRHRRELLSLWLQMPQAATAADAEVLRFVEAHRLMGRGLGYVDVHLLASTALSSATLWSRDRRLLAEAKRLGCAYEFVR